MVHAFNGDVERATSRPGGSRESGRKGHTEAAEHVGAKGGWQVLLRVGREYFTVLGTPAMREKGCRCGAHKTLRNMSVLEEEVMFWSPVSQDVLPSDAKKTARSYLRSIRRLATAYLSTRSPTLKATHAHNSPLMATLLPLTTASTHHHTYSSIGHPWYIRGDRVILLVGPIQWKFEPEISQNKYNLH